jgi:hypothetical protein
MGIPIRYIVLTKVHEPGVTCHRPGCDGTRCGMKDWRYALADGTPVPWDKLQPGDVYFNDAHDPTPEAAKGYGCPWDNCDGKHLMCILPPDNHSWNIDGRCSNCTLKEERTHRCWVRHGDPSKGTLHVDKNGHTCDAGAGSIGVTGYHGFLHNGELS